jgi:hypothetical protein
MEQPTNGKLIRSVIVNGAEIELQLKQDDFGKWTVFGIIPDRGGVVLSSFATADHAVEAWLE